MHRFFVSPENWNTDSPRLTGPEAHHARDVLRMKPGEKAVLFNGQGRELTAEATEVGRHEIRLRKLHESQSPPLRCRIALGQAIPKGKNMDLIVQKAVELGAAEIVPLISERTIVDLDPDDAAQKQAKWQHVAIEAAKQCGQNWLPQVRTPQKLKAFFSSFASGEAGVSPAIPSHLSPESVASTQIRDPRSAIRNSVSALRLIGSLQSDARHLKTILAEHSASAGAPPDNVLMLIGPEGDFTPAELALAKSNGCQPITLGPIILRVETAAFYCLSVLSYELL
jgi:16S rRNA (uracil1498-N3)-methyltransferase